MKLMRLFYEFLLVLKNHESNFKKIRQIVGGSETGTSPDLLYSRDRFCGTALGFCKEGNSAGSCSPQIGAGTFNFN